MLTGDLAGVEGEETRFLAEVVSIDVDKIAVRLVHKIKGEKYFLGNKTIPATLQLSPEAMDTVLDVLDDGKAAITVNKNIVTSVSRPMAMEPSPRFVSSWKSSGLEIITSNKFANEMSEKISAFKAFKLIHKQFDADHEVFASDFVKYAAMDCGCCTKIKIGYTVVCGIGDCTYKFFNTPQRLLVWAMFAAEKINPQFSVSSGNGAIRVLDVQTGFAKNFKPDELLRNFINEFLLPE
jgi:hypothetical protein